MEEVGRKLLQSGGCFVTIKTYQWSKVGRSGELTPQYSAKGAVRVFFGRYDCTIDAKGRLNFPAKFRDGMGDSFVVMEWLDQCLFALPMSEVERISERMGADELMDSWEITGDLFSTACEVTPDKQGRILLPAALRQYAGLGKTVAVIGNRNHAEIWDAARWDARRAAVTNEQRAARLRELHI